MRGELKLFGAFLTFSVLVGASTAIATQRREIPVEAASNYLEITTSHKISNSVVSASNGNTIWMSGESSHGVTYNTSTRKINIAAGGYIQNLTALNGINYLNADITSGSLSVYYSWQMPSALENPEYTAYTVLNASNKYIRFNTLKPSHIRVVAESATVLNKLRIEYDNSGCVDPYYEDPDYGMENYYVDPGSLNQYANTCYATHNDETYAGSKRSLKISFKNTTNNAVSISTQRESDAGLIFGNPNLSRSILTFKAKCSSDLTNKDIEVKAFGTNWTTSGYITATRTALYETGWNLYTIDFTQHHFTDNDNCIRLNIRPMGITSSNKSTAWVVLDEIECHEINQGDFIMQEETTEGLENMTVDQGNWNPTNAKPCSSVTFGTHSKNSLLVTPKTNATKHNSMKWCTIFEISQREVDLSEGILSFNYKPINVLNPEKSYVGIYKDWDGNNVTLQATGELVRDGWYRASVDLTHNSFAPGNYIRFGIGWDIANEHVDDAKIYLDNVLINKTPTENYTQGWENMLRDNGWEKCTGLYDPAKVASDTSINSLRMTFEGRQNNTTNLVGPILSPEKMGISNQCDMRTGTLTAKFLFSSNVTNYKVRVILVDRNWKAVRYDITPTNLANGWKKISLNLSSAGTPTYADSGYNLSSVIRVGFGFHGVTSTNMNTATVWMDDVFFSGSIGYNYSSTTQARLWWAYDSENILRKEAVKTDRLLSSNNRISFIGIKNETESGQLQVSSYSSVIRDVNFLPATLYNVDGTGVTFSADNFEVLWAKYQWLHGQTAEAGKVGYKGNGDYPDALVPLKNIIDADENYIEANCNQTIWINVHIPKTAQPGIYTGDAKLILDGAVYNVPMRVVIYNVTMSDTLHARSLFGIWYDQVAIGEGDVPEKNNALMKNNYVKFAEDHRINVTNYRENDHGVDSSNKNTYAEFYAKEIAFNDRVSSYTLDIADNKKTDVDEYKAYFNALINKNIELVNQGYDVNFFDKLTFLTYDEPSSSSDWNTVRNQNNAIRSAINATKYRLDNYPKLKASFVDFQSITTESDEWSNSELGGTAKQYQITPCPQFSDVNTAARRAAYQGNYNHVWWYGCINPKSPYPNYHLDVYGYYARAASWMQYYYDFDGELYWTINFEQQKRKGHDGWYNVDVWEDSVTWDGCAGDGRLVYPGERYGVYGPITTMRMEQIRTAKQEYEYLYMLDKGMSVYNIKFGTNYASVNQLLAQEFSWLINGTTTQVKSSFNSTLMQSMHDTTLVYLHNLYN